jgi:hypothetical protein
LEQPHELEQSTILQNRVVEQRQEMIKLWKDAHDRPDFDQSLLEERMAVYEDVLQVIALDRLLSFHYPLVLLLLFKYITQD